MSVLLRCLEQDEAFFGAGGSRRGTHTDDQLREDYLPTRLGLVAAVQQRNSTYFEIRSVLLRSRFAKRRTNRQVVEEELQKKLRKKLENSAEEIGQKTQIRQISPKPKRFRVADEYAFAGMHRL